MRFQVEGPFRLYRTDAGLVDSSALARRYYWDWVEEHMPGLPDACGCYIFAIRAPRGSLPWCVGKAERQSFRHECLTPHKIVHFNNALAGRKAKPELFFIPQVTPSGQYRSPTSSRRPAIRELESLLIGMAINRNPSWAGPCHVTAYQAGRTQQLAAGSGIPRFRTPTNGQRNRTCAAEGSWDLSPGGRIACCGRC